MDNMEVMLWAEQTPEGRPGTALWHVFASVAVPKIVNYIFSCGYAPQGEYNPILLQSICLTPMDLHNLREVQGVVPWVIEQRVGDTVCIPAGCPYQVCISPPYNSASCSQAIGSL